MLMEVREKGLSVLKQDCKVVSKIIRENCEKSHVLAEFMIDVMYAKFDVSFR